MKLTKGLLFSGIFWTLICLLSFKKSDQSSYEKLSEWNFFEGSLADQIPKKHIVPYQLSSRLFSDHAEKLRFVYVPEGKTIPYQDSSTLDLPLGSILIKTFYFPADFRKPEAERKLMETRLLVHESSGWQALDYVWNEAQTDAYLEVAGDEKTVNYIDSEGKSKTQLYTIPNQNQCKGCHSTDGNLKPIGPAVYRLNHDMLYAHGKENQIQWWQRALGLNKEKELRNIPKMADWTDSAKSIDQRARAWLDINCAHCHNPHGPAMTSGLDLRWNQKSETALGIYKTPVAAGRGSGGLKYDIHPGKPEKSILYYRMASLDPGVMMPELGRSQNQKESLELIKQWIKEMKP
jgi:uncharacterized repeat protein (TIGR03806 family)